MTGLTGPYVKISEQALTRARMTSGPGHVAWAHNASRNRDRRWQGHSSHPAWRDPLCGSGVVTRSFHSPHRHLPSPLMGPNTRSKARKNGQTLPQPPEHEQNFVPYELDIPPTTDGDLEEVRNNLLPTEHKLEQHDRAKSERTLGTL